MAPCNLQVAPDFLKGRKVLVAGATGVVSSRLVRALFEQRALAVTLARDPDLQSELYRDADIRNVAQCEMRSHYLSADKARSMLGWCPQYTLERGLSETIKWYAEFFAETER
jgi:nucleoside-diphosphate-sugar epimerase